MAVKSGAVKRILHFATDMDVQKYLADWRSAIGQGSDLILSIYGGLGNQAGPGHRAGQGQGHPGRQRLLRARPGRRRSC